MSSDSPSASSYRVSWLAPARSQLVQLKQLAMTKPHEVRLRFAGQLKKVMQALEFVPLEWSEPLDDITSLGLTTCIGFLDRIVVNFAVHQEQRIVFVRSIRILSGHELAR